MIKFIVWVRFAGRHVSVQRKSRPPRRSLHFCDSIKQAAGFSFDGFDLFTVHRSLPVPVHAGQDIRALHRVALASNVFPAMS
jgi:hypothetical protein